MTQTRPSIWLAIALKMGRFLVSLLLDSVWGFIFMAVGIAIAAQRGGVPLAEIADRGGVEYAFGAAVLTALLLRLPARILQWLERR